MQNQIERYLGDYGYTLRGTARKLNIPLKDLKAKLSGEQDFTLEEAHKLAVWTGKTIDSLFFEDLDSEVTWYVDAITREIKEHSANLKGVRLCWVSTKTWLWPKPTKNKEGIRK